MVRRWVLGGLAAAIAVPGVAFWDAHRRATATFERHGKDLAARVAAWKARPPLKPLPLFGEVLPGNGWDLFVRALEGFDAIPGRPFAWREDGRTPEEIRTLAAGPIEDLRRSLRHAEIHPTLPPDVVCPSRLALWGAFSTSDVLQYAMDNGRAAGDLLLLGFGMIRVFSRYAQPEFRTSAQIWEKDLLEGWETVLRSHALSTAELASLSRGLEALWAARVDVLDAVLVRDLLVRSAVVRGLSDEEAMSRGGERPEEASWRSLFSDRLRDARRLTEVEACRDALEALRRRSTRDRAALALAHSGPCGSIRFPLIYEAYVAARWTLARVGTALAWFEAETGARPARLDELVPGYLPSLPPCPLTGNALGYSPGSVWCHGPDVFEEGGLAKGVNPASARITWTVERQR